MQQPIGIQEPLVHRQSTVSRATRLWPALGVVGGIAFGFVGGIALAFSSAGSQPAEVQNIGVSSGITSLVSSTTSKSCVKIITGSTGANGGGLHVTVTAPNGTQLKNFGSTWYSLGSTLLDQCFTIGGVSVDLYNPTNDAWTGSVTYSADGTTYSPMIYAGASTSKIVVDGNSDSSDQATTQCFNGAVCALHPGSCVKITTGSVGANDGGLHVAVLAPNGTQVKTVSSTSYALGSTVLYQCFPFSGVSIHLYNPTNDAWAGTATYSVDGASYLPMRCPSCSTGTSNYGSNIVADGNSDSPDQGSTRCFNGATCPLYPAEGCR